MNQVDEENHRFPYSLVWTPIPLITYLFPFIGHMGKWQLFVEIRFN